MKQNLKTENDNIAKIYLAAPLFSDSERNFNEKLTMELEKFSIVYLPQRDGGLVSEMISNGTSPDEASKNVFQTDLEAIISSDFIIAILDGRAIDEGVAVELGIAYSERKRCIGLHTDSRRLAPWGNNPMVDGCLELVFNNMIDVVSWFKKEISQKIGNYKLTVLK